MKVLITGAKGFVGKNLVASLEAVRDGRDRARKIEGLEEPAALSIYQYDMENTKEELDRFCSDCDFVFNLAGVNRPKDPSEFINGNYGFASVLLDTLKKHGNTCPVMLSSSIQASLEGRYAGSEYGKSKKAGEDLFFAYGAETGVKVLVYRFSNLFGKWCRPNYNSVIATFCHNVAHGLSIVINDPEAVMNLIYIDDVVDELIAALNGRPSRRDGFCVVPVAHVAKLGEIAQKIHGFREGRNSLTPPNTADSFTSKLYATYLSYLPQGEFGYPLTMHVDTRGSFTEFLRIPERGQVSVNISKPGITKGNHWHHTKNEKFLVVSGRGIVRLRKIDEVHVQEYYVSGDKHEVIDIPPGYTHNIENLGDTDMVTIMWASECFDPQKPDTYFMEI